MKNLYERSLDDSNTDMDASSTFNETFFSYTVGRAKKSQGWIILALVVTLGIIFIILGILTGILFGHYSTMNDELSVLKYNVSDPVKAEISDLWKSVFNIMGDLSKLKDKVDITEGSCKTCPRGWKMIRSNCYYFSATSQTWSISKELCAERNGILLVVKDDFEMSSLWPTIRQGRFWIGLGRDPKDTDTWVWTNGSPLTYSIWNEGEPNNDRDNEHCAEVLGGVQAWNDRPCYENVNFICKGVWTC